MTSSATKLIAALIAVAVFLTTQVASAGNSSSSTFKHKQESLQKHTGSTTTTTTSSGVNTLRDNNIARGLKKEQQLQGNGFTVTQGGGNLPKEPGNNPDKGSKHDCNKSWCYDRCSSFYFGCSYPYYGCYDICYDYCVPTYECSYDATPVITVLPCVEPFRTKMFVGKMGMSHGEKSLSGSIPVSGIHLGPK